MLLLEVGAYMVAEACCLFCNFICVCLCVFVVEGTGEVNVQIKDDHDCAID